MSFRNLLISLSLIVVSSFLYPEEGELYPILLQMEYETEEEELFWLESKNFFYQLWREKGYDLVEDSSSITPLSLRSSLVISGEDIHISSALYRIPGSLLLGEVQAGGSNSLGFRSKWRFITDNLVELADSQDLSLPVIESEPAIAVISQPIEEERRSKLSLESLDVSFSSMIPIGRYGEFSLTGLGGELGVSFRYSPLPLDWRIALSGIYEWSLSSYVDTLLRFTATLQTGYTFPSKGWLSFGFRGAFGIVGHYAAGNLNTLEDIDSLFYVDQYYGAEAVLRIRIRESFSLSLVPGFFLFPGPQYWGMETSVKVGTEYHF